MVESAEYLARTLIVNSHLNTRQNMPFSALRKMYREMQVEIQHLIKMSKNEHALSIAGETLIDNAYVIDGNVLDILTNFPPNFYRQLPLVLDNHTIVPRIYVIASDLLQYQSHSLSKETIYAYLHAFQQQSPLKIGELWAFPLILRLRIVEQLSALTKREIWRQKIREQVRFWSNRILFTARHEPENLFKVLETLQKIHTPLNPYFAYELYEQLYDQEDVFLAIREWIEKELALTLDDLRKNTQVQEASEQSALTGAIRSLIYISRIYWPDVVESLSRVDVILAKDPAQVYLKMDFATRDAYRKKIEQLAKKYKRAETEVAEICLNLAKNGKDSLQQHVGFFLLDKGELQLRTEINHGQPLLYRVHEWIKQFSPLIYILGIGTSTGSLTLGFYLLAHSQLGPWVAALLTAFALIPISEIVIEICHWILSKGVAPERLPKMEFDQLGIPDDCRCLIVIPTLLHHEESLGEDLARLEGHYLGNTDPNLRFAIFSDFRDTNAPPASDDAPLIQKMKEGIAALNQKYGSRRFFLFHRMRTWSASEGCWIGWERKRGKLEQLNAFILGMGEDAILYEGTKSDLGSIRYVITLDADTELPKDCAAKLIGTLAHPLNAPRLSPETNRLENGYVIIQPRVETTLPSANATRFSQLFSMNVGTSPYQHLVSNVYQDFMSEGTYHGKGIYDVNAFHRILSHRFPESHVLSHDLLEGAFSRVGFASDIVLLDAFPPNYLTYSQRQHRWIRGDWQIIAWLRRRIPTFKNENREVNPLSMINQWKILDNLRRSLLPIGLLLLTISSIIVHSQIAEISYLIVILTLITPGLSLLSFEWLGGFYTLVSLLNQIHNFVLRTLYRIAVLPYEVFITGDALVRVFYRKAISKSLLLEWATRSNHFEDRIQSFHRNLLFISLFGLIIGIMVLMANPTASLYAIPFVAAWLIAPVIVRFYDKHGDGKQKGFSKIQKILIRKWARLSWRFFQDFASPQWNGLPPDNFQESLRIEEAGRTSPTNIGLFLTSLSSATQFGYLTIDAAAQRLTLAMTSMKKLERFQGHFLNWYDLSTLKPLPPSYISTVDSGNLLAALWTTGIAIDQWKEEPLIGPHSLEGLLDTIDILGEYIKGEPSIVQPLTALKQLFERENQQPIEIVYIMRQGRELCSQLTKSVASLNDKNILSWATALATQIEQWNLMCDRYFQWSEILRAEAPSLDKLTDSVRNHRNQALNARPSLASLAAGTDLAALLDIQRGKETVLQEVQLWLERLIAAFSQAQWFAGEVLGDLDRLQDDIEIFSTEINMRFLYDPERRLFSIGYNVTDHRMDTSYYDLLASEARLASLVAIAKGDVPIEHWWALGRPYGVYKGNALLLSWGGTMFEYLMPPLFTRNYHNSLLDQVCQMAVECQVDYGRARGIPWGISEAAYSRLDARHIYQYRSFGIPALGLRRGLEDDLVVSPYSSMLALTVDPVAAFKNLYRLAKMGLLSHYGFFESIDYSRQANPQGTRGVVIYAYMAHHVGMSFLAMDNILHGMRVVNCFHADPRIRAVEYLLYEKPPTAQQPTLTKDIGPAPTRLTAFYPRELRSEWNSPDSALPGINLLSNGSFSVMITNTGGSYSRWENLDITRWRSDTTRDSWGTFCYIKDSDSSEYTATTYQPTRHSANRYSAHFTADKAEFHYRGNQFIIATEVIVDPIHPAEVRKVSLHNISDKRRKIALTTYAELALAEHAADLSHPAFSKMFIETEALPEKCAIIAHRRPRSAKDTPIWIGLTIATLHPSSPLIEWETSREHFIGRGRSLQNPKAMDGPLTKSAGFVLDPIFSLRIHLTIDADERQELSFITVVANSREEVLRLIEIYRDYTATKQCMDSAWAHAQLQLRHLHVRQPYFQLFNHLAGLLLYPHSELRPSAQLISRNTLPINRLWAHGISGDLPILVLRIADSAHLSMVIELLSAHAFWRARGLDCDLVLLNDEATSYEAPLSHHLAQLVRSYAVPEGSEKKSKGNVVSLTVDQLPQNELRLLLAVAHVVLLTSRGSLKQQLSTPRPLKPLPDLLKPTASSEDLNTHALPFFELKHFNGLGGFTFDDKEYIIYLEGNMQTPAPWSNVLANSQFGALVTESGVDTVWKYNSQTNRLTPWSNDPICPSLGQALYIRDDERGEYWSVTPQPVREDLPYRIHHGQGYTIYEHNSHGISQTLSLFVPPDPETPDPILVQILSLTNTSDKTRHLSLFFYVEWVLGANRESMQRHVQTEWNKELGCLLARNPPHLVYANQIGFISASVAPDSFTCDRSEFIGRNQSLKQPAALQRQSLAKTCGAALDPCAALQINIDLLPGESSEFTFLLGQGSDLEQIRGLLSKYRSVQAATSALTSAREWWNKTLETLQFSLPDQTAQTLLNRWLLYQSITCRMWGRTGFYQSSGAYGFRDQLQDSMAIAYVLPNLTRAHILNAASQQFPEGDVLHWWHPEGGGVRTRISDDFLWLPLAVCHYVKITGDLSILQELVPFVEGRQLEPQEHEIYLTPEISQKRTSLLNHCHRALKHGMTAGAHGLPLMGGGDWNDGMNQVGAEGKGESIWLAWFTIYVFKEFSKQLADEPAIKSVYLEWADKLTRALEESSWDGRWYVRAYYDDGSPLGSKTRDEAKIDSISQSWATLSGAGSPTRSLTAMQSIKEHLVNVESQLSLLLTPPFNLSAQEPGYIKGYPPGIRENGGQYTHAAVWAAMAAVRIGSGDEGIGLLQMINPLRRTQNQEGVARYRVEPYVIAADVYSNPTMVGRGGWTWYTGSSAWLYRAWLEEVFGFELRGDELLLNPKMLTTWKEMTLTYRYHSTTYQIRVSNPSSIHQGQPLTIKLVDDGQLHAVDLELSPKA